MLDPLTRTLSRLQKSLSRRADQAYEDRDAAKGGSRAAAYAEGEGHAYGVAEGEVREALQANDDAQEANE